MTATQSSYSNLPPGDRGLAAGVPGRNPFDRPGQSDSIGWTLLILGYTVAVGVGWYFDQLLIALVTVQGAFFVASAWIAIATLSAIDRQRRACHDGYRRLCAMDLGQFARWAPGETASLLERACGAVRRSAGGGRAAVSPIVDALTEPMCNRLMTLNQLGEAATSFGMLGTMFGLLLPLQMLAGLAGQGVEAIAGEMLSVLGSAAMAIITTILGAANSVMLLGFASVGASRLDRLASQIAAQASVAEYGPSDTPTGIADDGSLQRQADPEEDGSPDDRRPNAA
jgi:hypothetical protein